VVFVAAHHLLSPEVEDPWTSGTTSVDAAPSTVVAAPSYRTLVAGGMGAVEVEVAEELEIDVEVTEPEEASGAHARQWQVQRVDVAVAMQSDSNFYESLDDERNGVFWATYQRLPIGTSVVLNLHIVGEGSFVIPATVRWVRRETQAGADSWPGLGLELDFVTDALHAQIERFKRVRPALFYP